MIPNAAEVREYLAQFKEQHPELTPREEDAISTVRDVLYDVEEAEEG